VQDMDALPSPHRASPNNKVHWLQNHWYRINPLHLILFPISMIFRGLVAIRRDMYRNGMLSSDQLLLPVIVVGNINVGGTGKTPLTLALARQLVEHGWHPLIVSRGFGGKAKLPQQVSAASDALQVGDEPLLMARRDICPVWVGRDRAKAARAALQAHPQCDVVLCDDGLQHYRLQRDIEIAVVDGERGFGNGLLLPAGPLREPESRLQEVDAVVVNGGEAAAGQYAMRLSGEMFHNLLDPGNQVTAEHFYGKKNHAVAGIGNPQRYFRYLESMGIAFTPHAFPDHHPYSSTDLSFPDCDAILLTEKDAVKCSLFADARYWVLRVDARIDPALLEYILRKITSHGSKTA
jgi:tetraacyldisaccharide 4'-kinase